MALAKKICNVVSIRIHIGTSKEDLWLTPKLMKGISSFISTIHFFHQIIKLKRNASVFMSPERLSYLLPLSYQNKFWRSDLHYRALTCHASIMPGWGINNSRFLFRTGRLVCSLQGLKNNASLLGSDISLNLESRKSIFCNRLGPSPIAIVNVATWIQPYSLALDSKSWTAMRCRMQKRWYQCLSLILSTLISSVHSSVVLYNGWRPRNVILPSRVCRNSSTREPISGMTVSTGCTYEVPREECM